MSPSKKVNKKATSRKKRITQKAGPTSTVRSARPARNQTGRQTKFVDQQIQTIPVETRDKPRGENLRVTLLRILAILAVIGITFYTYSIRENIEKFQALGYPGIFLIALIANATILLPAPGVAIVYAMGAVFNPIGVGIAAGSGGAIGELSGYLAGFSGQAVIEHTEVYERIKPWVDKYGGWAILVLSAIPNPLFDVAGIAAGIAKMRFWTFLFFIWIGQLIKMTLFALAGKYSIDFISNFIR